MFTVLPCQSLKRSDATIYLGRVSATWFVVLSAVDVALDIGTFASVLAVLESLRFSRTPWLEFYHVSTSRQVLFATVANEQLWFQFV